MKPLWKPLDGLRMRTCRPLASSSGQQGPRQPLPGLVDPAALAKGDIQLEERRQKRGPKPLAWHCIIKLEHEWGRWEGTNQGKRVSKMRISGDLWCIKKREADLFVGILFIFQSDLFATSQAGEEIAELLRRKRESGSSSSFIYPSNKDLLSATVECQAINMFPSVKTVQTKGKAITKRPQTRQSKPGHKFWKLGAEVMFFFQRPHYF